MLPRKKRKNLIITSIVIVLLVIIGILAYLYITTDAFKSNDTLFIKYLAQNFDMIAQIQNQNEMGEVKTLLDKNKYTSTTQAQINYITNKGLENEKKDNQINTIELKIDGQTDKANNYNYKDIKLVRQDENLIRGEYLDIDTNEWIRLDGIKQFVPVEEIYKEEQSTDILSVINKITQIEEKQLKNIFTQEEINTLMNKYINILISNTNKQAFKKQSNTSITINDSSTKANSYSITFTKEEFNNIYVQILEQLKQDEIILAKLDELDSKIREITNVKQELKQTFTEYITSVIETIKNSNIGQQQRTITVYERNGQTIRTQINSDEFNFKIDRLTNQNGIWIEIGYEENKEKANSWKLNTVLTTDENEESNYIGIETVKDKVKDNIEITNTVKIGNTTIDSQWEIKAYNEKNEVTLNVQKIDTIVNNFDDKITLNEENSINLENLDENEKNNIIQVVKENLQNQINKIQETVTLQDVSNMLINVDLLEQGMSEITEGGMITEAEKNRFNALFEFYQGEELEIESIQKMMEVVKDNLSEIKITEYEEKRGNNTEQKPKTFLIIIEKDKKNEELANLLLQNLKNDDYNSDKYSVKIEYNDTNGLVENIILSIK